MANQNAKCYLLLGVCVYPINSGNRCSGRVGYPSDRVFVIPRNDRVLGRNFEYPNQSDIRINQVCGGTWAFDVITYLFQLSENS